MVCRMSFSRFFSFLLCGTIWIASTKHMEERKQNLISHPVQNTTPTASKAPMYIKEDAQTLMERKVENIFELISIGEEILNRTLAVQPLRPIIYKLVLRQESFWSSNDTIIWMTREPTLWEKSFPAMHLRES